MLVFFKEKWIELSVSATGKAQALLPTTVINRSSGELVIPNNKCHRTPKITLSKVS
jgi:hypothetical protein